MQTNDTIVKSPRDLDVSVKLNDKNGKQTRNGKASAASTSSSRRMYWIAGVGAVVSVAGIGLYIWHNSESTPSTTAPHSSTTPGIDNGNSSSSSSSGGNTSAKSNGDGGILEKCGKTLRYVGHVMCGTVVSKISDKAHDMVAEAMDVSTYAEKLQTKLWQMIQAPVKRLQEQAIEAVENLEHEIEDGIEHAIHNVEDQINDKVEEIQHEVEEAVETVQHEIEHGVTDTVEQMQHQVNGAVEDVQHRVGDAVKQHE